MALPRDRKPADQLKRRNAPEQWVILPPLCERDVPPWPFPDSSLAEDVMWHRLWRLPIAELWHQQRIEPMIIARYVTLAITRPDHTSVSKLENELGLTPAALLRMRVTVETPEEFVPEVEDEDDPYADLIEEFESR